MKLKYFILISLLVIFLDSNCQTETYTWQNLKTDHYAEVTGLVTNSSEQGLFYARTSTGGAYRWNNQLNQWVPLLDWVSENNAGYLGVESIATDSKEPNRLYLLVGTSSLSKGKTAILVSDDYGNTFQIKDVSQLFMEEADSLGSITGEKLAIDPNQNSIIFCGTRTKGLFKSQDFGTTWNKVNSFPTLPSWFNNGISFILFDPKSGLANSATQTVIVGVSNFYDNNLFISKDGGASFSKLNCPSLLLPHRAALATDGNLYITFRKALDILNSYPNEGEVWRYDLGNAIWSNVTPPVFGRDFGGISTNHSDPNRLVVTTVFPPETYLTTDKGGTWTWLDGNEGTSYLTSVEFDPFDSQNVLASTFNGVLFGKITSPLIGWLHNSDGMERKEPNEIISLPNGPLIVDKLMFNNIHQVGVPYGSQPTGVAAATLNSSRLVSIGDYDAIMYDFVMKYSTDRGASWTSSLFPKIKELNGGKVAISSDGKTILYSPAPLFPFSIYPKNYFPKDSFLPWVTYDLGKHWAVSALNPEIIESYPIADPINPNKFFIFDYDGGGLMVSSDGGRTFTFAGNAGGEGSKIIRAMPDREGDLWIALYHSGLSRSVTSGTSFSKIANVSYCSAVGFGKKAPQSSSPTVYIWGTVNGITGIFRSTDEGVSWQRINDDQHQFGGADQFVTGDTNVFGRCYIYTRARGIIYGESNLGCEPTRINSFIKIGNNPIQNDTYGFFFAGDNVTLSPEPLDNGTWAWSGPGGFKSTSREVDFTSITNAQAGVYQVTYTNNDGCESAAQNIFLEASLVSAIEETTSPELELYPNPSPNIVLFRSKILIESAAIHDSSGRQMMFKNFNSFTGNLPAESLPPGLYLINFQLSGGKFIWKKFLKT